MAIAGDMKPTFKIAGTLKVRRIGYGAMRLTGHPSKFGPFKDWQGGLNLLRRAADLGVNFFDSAWSYGPETADQIVGEALEGRDVVLATKGGVDKPKPGKIVVDGSKNTLHRQIEKGRTNLRRDTIDLFQLHRVDPNTAIETSVEALAQAQAKGWIGHIGISNISREHLERALQVAPIASVQNRFNMAEADADGLVDYTADRGIAFIPYGPLGAKPMEAGAKLDPAKALAWLLHRSPNIVVIPGTTNIKHLENNVRALDNA